MGAAAVFCGILLAGIAWAAEPVARNAMHHHVDSHFAIVYLSAAIERELGLAPTQYRVALQEGELVVTLAGGNREQAGRIERALADHAARLGFTVRVQLAADSLPRDGMQYPEDDLFQPLVADLKEPRFFMSLLHVHSRSSEFRMGAVGLGRSFGMYRWFGDRPGDGWQLNFYGAAFSQFNLDTPSDDLLNTDYQVGIPLTFRHGGWSGRFRLYHQSSHLGDELILGGTAPDRIGLSFEVIDGLIARDVGDWRVYGGGGYLVRHTPRNLREGLLMAGIDYQSPDARLFGVRPVGGLHVTWIEERNWRAGLSLEAGVALGNANPHGFSTRIMLRAYRGVGPFGQFYTDDIRYIGLGWHIDL